MTTLTDLPIEHWPIGKLKPYAKNAKKHTPETTKKLVGVIRGAGVWTQPLILRENGEIIAGHGRRLAAIEMGLKSVPAVVVKGLSDAQAEAMRLADNKASTQDYDTAQIRESLTWLAGEDDVDVNLLGYEAKELSFLTEDPAEFDESAFVEDISEAVEEQQVENTKKAAAVDTSTMRVADALGFGKLTVEQGRRVKAFIAKIEGETGETGADALMGFLDAFGVAA
ncbi:ParB/Srx family N-terminal domain-containing protein [Methylobacterium sp. AMS5]|uniref:ParB N-terminal domain-containing protein n=1 Tax=Methylobacterium sp. AMS5 TaxID=925818 RepID=UPI00074F9400|nr:ParB/Srx family N-terminal domain-containing protein [Methylobacterium sp. AMS5]AMB48284.1 hypothetical protein Y590_25285 [Methylobacterium sp. AMS5]